MSNPLLASRVCGAVILATLIFSTGVALAQQAPMYPMEAPPEPNAFPLGTGGVEGQENTESWFRQWGDPMARNISTATLTPFLPDPEKATGAAVLVAPGGGFMWLSMGNEGWEVAEALAEKGIAAFVLKYRLRPTPDRLEDFEKTMNNLFADMGDGEDSQTPRRRDYPFPADQVADVEAAYAMIVDRADEWGVDPQRLGMMGFSAGAGATMAATLHSEEVRFAFIAPIYGGMQAVEVPGDAPPLFTAIASDDFLFGGEFGLVRSWFEAGKPVELHLYQNGGHGFGLGNPDRTSNIWFDAYIHWLDVNGFLESPEPGSEPVPPPADAFLAALAPYCGNAYAGRVVADVPASDDVRFADKPLVMHVASCTEDEIRIPFHVGEDRSRTWVLTRTPAGLRLKHDHRHEDGSEDPVSRYGGTATSEGTALRQEFPVDAESIAVFEREGLQASTSNTWAMEIGPGQRFGYELSRPGGRLFQVEFDLATPVATPPAPWGAGVDTITIGALEWAVTTNGEDIKWPDAVTYCEDLELAGHSDWRLPMMEELKSLHDPDAPGGESIRDPLSIGGCCLWSGESLVDRAAEDGDEIGGNPEMYQWGFMFDGGHDYYAVHIFDDGRAMCVRDAP